MGEFLKLIREGGIGRPEIRVIEKLRHEYVNQLGGNIDSVGSAMNLYRMIKEIPSTATRTIIKEQLQIRVNGALSIELLR